jgi:hypothetical protein
MFVPVTADIAEVDREPAGESVEALLIRIYPDNCQNESDPRDKNSGLGNVR